ncbi:hypothetical protein EHQ53_16405 [Leptospira langatensis]|uniref:Uncharacterized protein n=1 Tax=Leptospira langatensis TaxID=2484983 RepID=A0A5F1ZNF0_9LEPT|nr:hypothetical protein [Leptospira langatensis]TGK05223.1 hypothetical protein EHO57_00645 [Leptospira langatensis]TGL38359.1 hypothetical protein EHQ53_16405 [Leptospira langatensis]
MQFIRRYWPWLLLSLLVILCFSILLWPEKDRKSPSLEEEASEAVDRKYGSSNMEFPDAPHPFQEDPDLEQHAKRLWPSAFQERKTQAEREKIKDEWADFAVRYPRNIYIPREFRPPLSQEDEKKARERLDKVTSAESKFALARNAGKYAQPGSAPTRSGDPNVSPEEQKAYFAYKISELESRIQLVHYAIQQGKMDPSQLPQANNDISAWQKELQQLQQASSSVP